MKLLGIGPSLRTLERRYSTCTTIIGYYPEVVKGLLYFVSAMIITSFAATFASREASNPVTDIILSNTPSFKVDDFFVYGAMIMIGCIVYVSMVHPRRIPFTLSAISLFYVIRAFFISLTHIALFPLHSGSDFGHAFTEFFFGGSDLFFSGHTGAPFLFALMYWREPLLRNMFLGWSVFFATVVLLGHLHYSIDVASAFFITYTIYHLALYLFPRSRVWFVTDDRTEKRVL